MCSWANDRQPPPTACSSAVVNRWATGFRREAQGDTRLRAVSTDADQFQTRSAHIGGQSIGAWIPGRYAQRGEASLLLAGQNADLQPCLCGHPMAKGRPVGGLPDGGGGGNENVGWLDPVQHGRKTAQCRHGQHHALL